MNMVMILIPLLLLSTVFLKAGVINITAPRSAVAATSDNEESPEEERVPQVVVFVSEQGFFLSDQRNDPAFEPFAARDTECDAAAEDATRAATLCLRADSAAGDPLVQRLDYAALYNALVRIRLHPEWADGFSEEGNDVVRVVADPNIPFEAIVATMDTARYFVEPGSGGAAVPGAGSDASAYALPRGVQGAQALASAAPLMAAEGEAEPLPLFPYPVLLTARPQGAL
jgi:biopolymer transport protein ExbD